MRSVGVLSLLFAAGHVVAAAACGPSPAATMPARSVAAPLDAGLGDAAVDPLPSLDALAARGPTDAPLMREALRVERAAPRSADVRADRDTCLRATFAATSEVRAWFADESGAPRGESTTAAMGAVPPRGPVCAKKGEALHLVVETAAPLDAHAAVPNVRAVVFVSP